MSVSRRRFLRGSAGLFLALPILESMRPRTVSASDPTAPQRALWWFTPNGQNMKTDTHGLWERLHHVAHIEPI